MRWTFNNFPYKPSNSALTRIALSDIFSSVTRKAKPKHLKEKFALRQGKSVEWNFSRNIDFLLWENLMAYNLATL